MAKAQVVVYFHEPLQAAFEKSIYFSQTENLITVEFLSFLTKGIEVIKIVVYLEITFAEENIYWLFLRHEKIE